MMWEGADEDGRRFVVGHVAPKHHERFRRDTNFRWLSGDLSNWISRTQSRWNALRTGNSLRSIDSTLALPQTSHATIHAPSPMIDDLEGWTGLTPETNSFKSEHNQTKAYAVNSVSSLYSILVPSFRLDVYHPLDEIYSYLEQLSRQFKHIRLTTIGYSHERRPLMAIEVQQDPQNVGKKLIYLDALVHAREWITAASLLRMLEQIVLQRIPCNFLMVPVINPDGYSYTWTHDRLWRKNRRYSRLRQVLRNEKCVGVDLNRNFDINFAGEGASSYACSQLYAGDRPFSEPETAALARIIADRRKEIRLLISLHSFNQLWSSPYAYTLSPSPHFELHRKVLKEVQSAVYSVSLKSNP
jgi:hypothetical protein